MRSGSTLGAIGLSQATVLSADLGVPQLAMHSAVETMALSDAEALHKGLRSFWTHRVRVRSDRARFLCQASVFFSSAGSADCAAIS